MKSIRGLGALRSLIPQDATRKVVRKTESEGGWKFTFVRAKRVWCKTLRLPIKSRLNLTRKHPRRRRLIGKPQRRIFSTARNSLLFGGQERRGGLVWS